MDDAELVTKLNALAGQRFVHNYHVATQGEPVAIIVGETMAGMSELDPEAICRVFPKLPWPTVGVLAGDLIKVPGLLTEKVGKEISRDAMVLDKVYDWCRLVGGEAIANKSEADRISKIVGGYFQTRWDCYQQGMPEDAREFFLGQAEDNMRQLLMDQVGEQAFLDNLLKLPYEPLAILIRTETVQVGIKQEQQDSLVQADELLETWIKTYAAHEADASGLTARRQQEFENAKNAHQPSQEELSDLMHQLMARDPRFQNTND